MATIVQLNPGDDVSSSVLNSNFNNLNSAISTSSSNISTLQSNVNSLQSTVSGLQTTILSALYPIGSIYIGTQATCPLATLISGSTWTKIEGRYLLTSGTLGWSSETYAAGDNVAPGLPNITGSIKQTSGGGFDGASGAFSRTNYAFGKDANRDGDGYLTASFSAANNSSIYGQSTTVRPPAFVVNVWARTA